MAFSRNTRLPTFFVIGAGKCGTTSLHHYLGLHPEISMSSIKEPDHFSPEGRTGHDNSIRSRAEYLSLFRAGTKNRGESSTSYSRDPVFPGVPGRIAAEIPNARFIYLVRDPVERIESAIRERMSARRGEMRGVPVDTPIAEVLGEFRDPFNGFSCSSDYIRQIRRYLEFFPGENLMVIDSDELRSKRHETLARIFEFLEVDAGFRDERMEIERNTAAEKTRVGDRYIWVTQARPVRSIVERLPRKTRRRLSLRGRAIAGRPWTPPVMEDRLRSELREFFSPSVEALREFTGQDFQGWSI